MIMSSIKRAYYSVFAFIVILGITSLVLCQTFGDGVQNPSISTVVADYDCKRSKLIKSIKRYNFAETRGAKCNQIKRELKSVELNLVIANYTKVNITATGSNYIYDYGGIRTVIFNGQIDPTAPFCSDDRIVLYEKAVPKKGSCVRGIVLHEAPSSFAKIGGICDSFCSGKTVTQYVRPLGHQ